MKLIPETKSNGFSFKILCSASFPVTVIGGGERDANIQIIFPRKYASRPGDFRFLGYTSGIINVSGDGGW